MVSTTCPRRAALAVARAGRRRRGRHGRAANPRRHPRRCRDRASRPAIRLHGMAVELAVGLGARPAHRRALAAVQDAELDAGAIDRPAHDAVERIDLAHQMALAEAADRRVARHLADRRALVRQQQRARARPAPPQRPPRSPHGRRRPRQRRNASGSRSWPRNVGRRGAAVDVSRETVQRASGWASRFAVFAVICNEFTANDSVGRRLSRGQGAIVLQIVW